MYVHSPHPMISKCERSILFLKLKNFVFKGKMICMMTLLKTDVMDMGKSGVLLSSFMRNMNMKIQVWHLYLLKQVFKSFTFMAELIFLLLFGNWILFIFLSLLVWYVLIYSLCMTITEAIILRNVNIDLILQQTIFTY